MLVSTVLIMIYIRNLIWKLPNYSTIQKLDFRQFPELNITGFADSLKLDVIFSGVHFLRWRVKVKL